MIEKLMNILLNVCSICALILIPTLTAFVLYILFIALEDLKAFKKRSYKDDCLMNECIVDNEFFKETNWKESQLKSKRCD
jgi:hypothetical protein